jgi:3-dehydroquinate synthase
MPAERGAARVRVETRPAAEEEVGYDVLVGAGRLAALPALVREHAPAHRYAVVADETVARLYGDGVLASLGGAGLRADLLSFPPGEANKTRERWASLSDLLLGAGFGRDSALLALGGGVTGDLAGFVAATYMRGLPLVQVPTTLLAMIDSSVGGKTGVDTPAGKNLVGAFLQPRLVVADPEVLRTLPPAELRAGLAEAIKHGAIADAGYLDEIADALPALLALEPGALARLVVRSVEIKAAVVARDEREQGPRKMLNFGHTLGHALEAVSGYRLLHGEAVAIGMVLEAALGERLGVTETGTEARLRGLLRAAGLPTAAPGDCAPGAVLEATRLDKKARGGRVEYALVERIGRASPGPDGRWGRAVEDEVVLAVLERRGRF